MISNDFLKRTPVRLAGAFAILFALTVIALVTVLYFTLVTELDAAIRQHVEEMSDTLKAIDRQQGFDDLAAVVAEEAESVRDFDSLFLLRGEDGSFRAGNVQNVRLFTGWGELDRGWLPMVANKGNPDDRFFAIWTPVSKGHLLVGGSDREIREVRRILLHGLGWALVATLLLAVGSATYLARRAQQKIDVFATTLSKVSRGEISERVPVTASHDDLDHVAAQINATLAHLQKLIESVNQASSDIAHDLKKPIGRLRRRLELALGSADDADAFRTQVEQSLQEARQHRRDIRGAAAHHAARGRCPTRAFHERGTRHRAGRHRRHLRAGSGRIRRSVRQHGGRRRAGAGDGRPRAADAIVRQSHRERHPSLAAGYPHRRRD